MRTALLITGLSAISTHAAPSSVRSTARGDNHDIFPLKNGFPNPSPAQVKDIQTQAHGTLPNGDLPKKIEDTSAAIWSLIAANELFEVAYFSDLIKNISNSVPGYEVGSAASRDLVLDALKAVEAQEELHALGANGILTTAGRDAIRPCRYQFPVDNFNDAINFAATFTDVVLGTLQEALTSFGLDGDTGFLGLVGSVIGQEGEQNGFYRHLSPYVKVPSSLPFLTASSGSFALSALVQSVIVPGSCPDALPVPTFEPLAVKTKNIGSHTRNIDFSIQGKDINDDKLWVVYINQQNTPVVEKVKHAKHDGEQVSFTVPFPFDKYQMNGLTIAAVTNSSGPFANASAVAASTKFGPGLIEIN